MPTKRSPKPAATLQRSRFAHLYRRDGAVCFFHALTRRMFFGGELLAATFDDFGSPVSPAAAASRRPRGNRAGAAALIRELREAGLLIESPEEDVRAFTQCFQGGLRQYKIHHMYLLPTSECNFRCAYCFVEDDQRPFQPGNMDIATAEQVARTFARIARGNGRASVTFYGGEPLLNPKTTFFLLGLFRELQERGEFPDGLEISLLTNGSLVGDEAIRVFKETRPGIGVSIDGPR